MTKEAGGAPRRRQGAVVTDDALTDWLMDVFETMLDHFGPRGWWPASSRYEMAVGAILTQSVAWRNVEQAIANLKGEGLLDPFSLDQADEARVAALIVPALYYRQKAKRLKAFTRRLVAEYGGDIDTMLSGDPRVVRARLLEMHGIGPETADSMLLYAGDHPIFVVDAYTRRIFHRLGLWTDDISYETMQHLLHSALAADVPLYNEYHALIVGTGNRYCRAKKPLCEECPLLPRCPYGSQRRRAIGTKEVGS